MRPFPSSTLLKICRVSRKGQIVIPTWARDLLGVAKGDKVTLEVRAGALVVKALRPHVGKATNP